MGRVRKGRDIDAALQKKGFIKEVGSDHVRYFFFSSDGSRVVIQTKMSHGMMGSTIDVNILSHMAKQLRLTKSQFLDLIDCTLDEEGFREILTAQGLAV